jgi:mRNA-degrading endonuclease RelE of RelBE toxin-antitoxin system
MSSKVNVKHTKGFLKDLKRLLKKYPSLISDLEQLNKILLSNPKTGAPLGSNTYKIRLAIKSKSKGKSEGARVISHVETELIAKIENTTVTLLTIYDKSEVDSVSIDKILPLIRNTESGDR